MADRFHTPDETEDPVARKIFWVLLLIPLIVFAGWIVLELLRSP